MTVTFTRIDPAGRDREGLIRFMTGSRWPMHMRPQLAEADVEESIADGAYGDEDNQSFWIDSTEHGRVGFVRLEDLADPTPLFDLRLAEEHRGKGLGLPILKALTDHVFETMPGVDRFEGQTRDDNVAMRRTFVKAGWVKEAHYRRGWPVDGDEPRASVAYAMLRQDWENGTTTPVPWDDLPA